MAAIPGHQPSEPNNRGALDARRRLVRSGADPAARRSRDEACAGATAGRPLDARLAVRQAGWTGVVRQIAEQCQGEPSLVPVGRVEIAKVSGRSKFDDSDSFRFAHLKRGLRRCRWAREG